MTTAVDKINAHDHELDRLKSYEVPLGMTLIEAVTLASASSTVTLPSSGSISTNFSSIKLMYYARATNNATSETVNVQLDGDTAGNYDWVRYSVNSNTGLTSGSGLAAASAQISAIPGGTAAANYYDTGELTLTNIKGLGHKAFTTTYSTKVASTAGNFFTGMSSGWWRSLSAVGSIKISPTTAACSLAASSMFALYGIY